MNDTLLLACMYKRIHNNTNTNEQNQYHHNHNHNHYHYRYRHHHHQLTQTTIKITSTIIITTTKSPSPLYRYCIRNSNKNNKYWFSTISTIVVLFWFFLVGVVLSNSNGSSRTVSLVSAFVVTTYPYKSTIPTSLLHHLFHNHCHCCCRWNVKNNQNHLKYYSNKNNDPKSIIETLLVLWNANKQHKQYQPQQAQQPQLIEIQEKEQQSELVKERRNFDRSKKKQQEKTTQVMASIKTTTTITTTAAIISTNMNIDMDGVGVWESVFPFADTNDPYQNDYDGNDNDDNYKQKEDDHINDNDDGEHKHDILNDAGIAEHYHCHQHHGKHQQQRSGNTTNNYKRRNEKKKDSSSLMSKENVARFKKQVLDESYFSGLPVPLTMIEAASFYKQGQHQQEQEQQQEEQRQQHEFESTRTARTTTKSVTNNNYLMPGSHKHLGGAYDPTDGCIYGVPANARSVLCLYPVKKSKSETNKQRNDEINRIDVSVSYKEDTHEDSPSTTNSVANSAPISGVTTANNNNNEKKEEAYEYEYQATTIPLPESCYKYQYKWLRGIFAHGYLWAIPAWADSVLWVDVDRYWGRRKSNDNDNPIVQLIPLPHDHVQKTWQWHGAGINHNKTAIYCIPSNSEQVLKVDLVTKTTSFIPINGYDPVKYKNFNISTTTNKWYGGIVGADNCVYGIPYGTCSILQINCNTDTATLIGPDYGNGKYNWHGGIQVNGIIYAHPSHADTVLVINTNINTNTNTNKDTPLTPIIPLIQEIPIIRASYDHDIVQTYKWLGGSIGIDGNIYCPACDSSAVLKINVQTQTCTTFGYAGTLKNKWQGGLLGRDGCVYCIPASGLHILRIATNPESSMIQFRTEHDRVQLIGNVPAHKDKWQGGYQGIDGALYFIPENGYRVMKVIPPPTLVLTSIGTLRDDDFIIEML